MKFYEYNQNNSGGHFDVDDKVCHRLFIEAESKEQANDKAEELGVYFDGVEKGMDCDCCGDRWSTPWRDVELPLHCGTFSKAKAEAIGKKYKATVQSAKKPFGHDGTHEVVFETVESYARYLANEYGWTKPDVRIYYVNGSVLTIESESSDV